MVCFWAPLWLVYRFLIRPVGAVLDDRQRRVDGAQREWAARNEEHRQALAKIEAEMHEAARDAAAQRAAARQQAMGRRQTALDAARAQADARLAEVLAGLDRDAAAARAELARRGSELARLLAGRLLGRELAS
jgi:F-type H+-transporting ATPase subunit b